LKLETSWLYIHCRIYTGYPDTYPDTLKRTQPCDAETKDAHLEMAGVAHQWQNMLQTHLDRPPAVKISSQGDGRIDIRIESIHALLAKNILKMIYNVHIIIPSNHFFSVGGILQSIFDIKESSHTNYIHK